MNKIMIRNLKRIKIYMYNMRRVRSHIRIGFVICISKSKCKKIVTAIIVIGHYCLYIPTKRKA